MTLQDASPSAQRLPPLLRDAHELEAVHLRYQIELVEARNICPFARRAREQGRVLRQFLDIQASTPNTDQLAELILDMQAGAPAAEILLLVCPPPQGHAWRDADSFDQFCRGAHQALDRARASRCSDAPPWYMVSFHPASRSRAKKLTPESFVAALRRSPDPLIQCVRADVLDDVRARAQVSARERLRDELQAIDPTLGQLFDRSIVADSELSSDIARHNFAQLASGPERAQLEQVLRSIAQARARLLPPAIVCEPDIDTA